MKTFLTAFVSVSSIVLASQSAAWAQAAATQPATHPATTATSQPATQKAPESKLPTLAGRWSVKRTANTNTTALGQLVTDIAAADTWTVAVNKDQLAVSEEKIVKAGKPFSKEKPTTQNIVLEVSGLSVTGDKAVFTVKEVPLKHARGATITTTYTLQLGAGALITGTYVRDSDIAGPLGSIRSHEEGSVELSKLAS